MLTSPVCFRERYTKLDYSVKDLEAAAGGKIAVSDVKETVLMARMREPSLSLHGIEGAFSGVGAKTVIPASIAGKFSLRSVRILLLIPFSRWELIAISRPQPCAAAAPG